MLLKRDLDFFIIRYSPPLAFTAVLLKAFSKSFPLS